MTDPQDPAQPPRNEGRPPIDPSYSAPPPPPPPGYPPPYYAPPPPKAATTILTKIVTSVLTSVFVISIVANVYFAIILSQQVHMGPVVEQTYQAGKSDKRITILPISGVIADDMAGFVHEAVKHLDENPPAAIVLRVNSGGGTVGASDRIWHELQTFRDKHPEVKMIASFGSYAASGGYYVATPADHIVAETTCITGSIGVMGQLFTFEGLLDKVGVSPVTMVATDSPNKDTANDITRTWTEQDRAVVQTLLDNAYGRFLEVVSKGRKDVLTEDEVKAIATGKVFTAQEALDAKLIDEIGYLDDAIIEAANQVNLQPDNAYITVIASKPTLMQALMGADNKLPEFSAEQVRTAMTELGMPRLSYTMQLR